MTWVNKQDHGEAKNQPAKIEDLTLNPDQAAEVKGGDHKDWIMVESVSFPSRPGSAG